MPSFPRTHTTIHLRETQATTQAQEYSQKRLSTTHGHATGNKTSIITNFTVVEKREMERWAKSHVGFFGHYSNESTSSRLGRDGSNESTSSRIRRRSAGTPYSGNWDLGARIEDRVSKISSRIGGMDQTYPRVGGKAQSCGGAIEYCGSTVLFMLGELHGCSFAKYGNDKTNQCLVL